MRRIFLILSFCFGALGLAHAVGPDKHVVLLVWDGMRPDFINATNTPTLYDLSRRGVFFAHHHSVYVTSTEVNGTALATGDYPEHGGVIGNREYRPAIDPLNAIATESLEAMRIADPHGGYLAAPTIAETLQRAGYHTAIAGCKPVVLLHDHAERAADAANVVLYEGETLPSNLAAGFRRALGPFKDVGDTKTNRDLWTARALTEQIWAKDVPAFSLLWLGEPDNTQHGTGVGSTQSLTAIRNSDHALSRVIAELKNKGVYGQTDIFVVSDHGFSTISNEVDLVAGLNNAGFRAMRKFKTPPAKGDVLLLGLGGSALLYVVGHDENTIDDIVKFLQTKDYVGTIFTAGAREGTFTLDDAMIRSQNAPDIAVSFRWWPNVNPQGAPGYIISEAQGSNLNAPRDQQATHASLSPFDLHNTLVAAGPDLRQGLVDETPSGNVDVAPTVLKILGVKLSQPMDGRVLVEALNSENGAAPKVEIKELHASAKLPTGEWSQKLTIDEVNGTRYIDQGSGEFTASGTRPGTQLQRP